MAGAQTLQAADKTGTLLRHHDMLETVSWAWLQVGKAS
jgi:hypothetical protein